MTNPAKDCSSCAREGSIHCDECWRKHGLIYLSDNYKPADDYTCIRCGVIVPSDVILCQDCAAHGVNM